MRLIDADELIEYIQGSDELLDFQKDECIECINACDTADSVCEWQVGKVNHEWKPACKPNSVHLTFGVSRYKYCPYCGKRLKVV